MSHPIPSEVAAIIVDHAADDKATLKNLALASPDFCALAQSHIFSTVILNGRARRDRLDFFEELLMRDQDRGAVIAGYIRHLALFFCDEWFTEVDEDEDEDQGEGSGEGEGEGEDNGEGGAEGPVQSPEPKPTERDEEDIDDSPDSPGVFDTVIAFISAHIKCLRSIHLGPFSDVLLEWSELSYSTQNAITRLLTSAEGIALEGVANMPATLFRKLGVVKSLELADVIPSLSFANLAPASSLPAPTSLAIHTGMFAFSPDDMWDMTSFLHNMTYGRFLDFSHLTTLHLHLMDNPKRNRMINQLLVLSADCLQSLRLYIWSSKPYDGNVINLSDLSSLQSLTLAVNLGSMRDSFQYLAEAIGTISIPKTHLTELRLVPDVDVYHDWRVELAGTMILARELSEVWKTPLTEHISRILCAWKDTCIWFEFPAQYCEGPDPDVFNCMSDLLALDGMESSFRERLTFNIREYSVREDFMLRDRAELSIARAAPLMPNVIMQEQSSKAHHRL